MNPKTLFLLFWICRICTPVLGQNYDYNWILGYGYVGSFDSTKGENDGVLFDFSSGTLKIIYYPKPVEVGTSALAMSDSTGNFLFYSNGKAFYGADNVLIENGDSINYGEFYWDYSTYPVPQGQLALPIPNHPNQYQIFHLFVQNLPGIAGLINAIKISRIDMNQNGGKGKVVEKNIELLRDTLVYGQLTGVKHGNGRDWWIIQPEYRSNKYYKWLLTPDGIEGPFEQRIGKVWSGWDWSGQAKFNRDGSKYIRYDIDNDLNIFDFDRCTGTLSNPVHVEIRDSADIWNGGGGIAVSPNNRYLYVSSFYQLYQFDLLQADIAASKIQVDTYVHNDFILPQFFYLAQEAPDGKIYIVTSCGCPYLHVIHEPNQPGKSCNFEQRGIELPVYNGRSIPHHINYRLGALKGSPCDSLSPPPAPECAEGTFKLYPNPASDKILIEQCKTKVQQEFHLYDVTGKLILKSYLPAGLGTNEVRIAGLSNGMYFYKISENGIKRRTGKILKME